MVIGFVLAEGRRRIVGTAVRGLIGVATVRHVRGETAEIVTVRRDLSAMEMRRSIVPSTR
jgi:hypothetical protein